MKLRLAARQKVWSCAVVACLLATCSESIGMCEGIDTPAMTMRISLASQYYLVGEPILVKCEFTNISKEEIRFYPVLATEFDFIGFSIKSPDGKVLRFRPGVCANLNPNTSAPPAVIPPGGTWMHLYNPLVGLIGTGEDERLDFAMRSPGVYEITATYENHCRFTVAKAWQGKVSSNTVSLQVKPANGEDASALTALWDSALVRDYFADPGHSSSPKKIEAFRNLLREYPSSTYALYASYYLAEACQTINPHQLDDAIAQYRLALEKLPETHPLHALAECNQGVCLCEAGKNSEGVEVLKRFVRSQKVKSMQVVEAEKLIASGGMVERSEEEVPEAE